MTSKENPFPPAVRASCSGAPDLTYGQFIELVKARRLSELEYSNPGETARNNNLAGNMTRSVRAFMFANGLTACDFLGQEMLDDRAWHVARDKLGAKNASQKSLAGKARLWALEAFRAEDKRFCNETFGERLSRLRKAKDISLKALARSLSIGSRKIDYTVLKNWENGSRHPAPGMFPYVERLEVVLEVTPGTLASKLPKQPWQSSSPNLTISSSMKRRVAKHLPENFGILNEEEQEEILIWVSKNILSTPKEVLEDGKITSVNEVDIFFFALSRETSKRLKVAPKHLLDELDEICCFRTAKLPPQDMQRNGRWAEPTHKKADYDLRAFFGAMAKMGVPEQLLSTSLFLAPEAIERFIDWRHARRGGYTRTLLNLLVTIQSLLHPETGFVSQKLNFGQRLHELPGFVSVSTVERVATDWAAACEYAHQKIYARIKAVETVLEQGRDPFEALLPVLDSSSPLSEYYSITHAVRDRMPGPEYPIRLAEAQRSLMMLRIGLATGFRSKNLRQLLLCAPGETPRTRKELTRLKRAELRMVNDTWWIGIPREAFKNFTSNAVDDWNEFPIVNLDNLYQEIGAYLEARETLLSGHEDPGTFFIKTMSSRAQDVEYSSTSFYSAFRAIITSYGIQNPYTGQGAIRGLKPHGPHSMRHVLATHIVKGAKGVDGAAAALFDTPETIKKHYGRFLPGDRHREVMGLAWSDVFSGDMI